MKTTIWLTTLAAMSSIFVSAQSAKQSKQWHDTRGISKAASAKPLPQTTTKFSWNENTMGWDLYPDTIYRTYNSGGNILTENTAYYDSSFSYSSNRSFVYNAMGKEIASYQVDWNGMTMTWDTTSKSVTTYDNLGAGSEYIYYSKDMGGTGDWMINYAYKNIPTYDANNKVIEDINQEWVRHLNAYRNSDKSVYTYNGANQISGLNGYNWDTVSNTFVVSIRIKDVVWHSWLPNDLENSAIISYTAQEWDGTDFIDAERALNAYDSQDNQTEEKNETWSGTEWEVDYWNQYTLTYSANDELIQRITKGWDDTEAEFLNEQKEVFADFYVPTTVGLNNINNLQQAFSVFPNPINGNGTLTVQFTTATEGAALSLTDVTGKELLNVKLESTETNVQLPVLKTGLYIYKTIENNKVIGTGKLTVY